MGVGGNSKTADKWADTCPQLQPLQQTAKPAETSNAHAGSWKHRAASTVRSRLKAWPGKLLGKCAGLLLGALQAVVGYITPRFFELTSLRYWPMVGQYMFLGWKGFMLVLPLRLHLASSLAEWLLISSTALRVNSVYHGIPPASATSLQQLLASALFVLVLPAAGVMWLERGQRARYQQLQQRMAEAGQQEEEEEQQQGHEKESSSSSSSRHSSTNGAAAVLAAAAEAASGVGCGPRPGDMPFYTSLAATMPVSLKVHTAHSNVGALSPLLGSTLAGQLSPFSSAAAPLQLATACFPGCVQLLGNIIAVKPAAAGGAEAAAAAAAGGGSAGCCRLLAFNSSGVLLDETAQLQQALSVALPAQAAGLCHIALLPGPKPDTTTALGSSNTEAPSDASGAAPMVTPGMMVRAWGLGGWAQNAACVLGLGVKAWMYQVPFHWFVPLMTLEVATHAYASTVFSLQPFLWLAVPYGAALALAVAVAAAHNVLGRRLFWASQSREQH
ncbi:hypothetical protein OEZ86_010957 [Tetradesmus obliquus]|nr:hypothetical protein OEZ86_010957 [Tetradesmus obliquus]